VLFKDIRLKRLKSGNDASAATDKPAATAKHWTNSLGMVFIPVPRTSVLFSIWDTRLQDFEKFVNDTGYDATTETWSKDSDGWKKRGATWRQPGFEQGSTSPVCAVSWDDAKAFCRWLTLKERSARTLVGNQSYRLPTDAEWSSAVGSRTYPWGNQWPPPAGAGNYAGSEAADSHWPKTDSIIEGYRDGYPRTSPVGSFAANAYGLYDMGGNLWQWCEDWYSRDMNSAESPANQWLDKEGGGPHRVLRGAAWDYASGVDQDQQTWLSSACRFWRLPGCRGTDLGFRCVLVP